MYHRLSRECCYLLSNNSFVVVVVVAAAVVSFGVFTVERETVPLCVESFNYNCNTNYLTIYTSIVCK